MGVFDPLQLPDPLNLTKVREDGSRLSTSVAFLGGFHHMTLFRVHDIPAANDDYVQEADDAEDQPDLEALQDLYTGRYETVQVPGFTGDYVVYMHPFTD